MNERNRQLIGFIGLMARARNLSTGEQLLEDIKRNKVYVVILAEDIGKSVYKKLTDKCKTYKIPYYQVLNKDEMSKSIGKQMCSALGITNQGATNKVENIMKAGE